MKQRGLIIYSLLAALCAAFIVWQFIEHRRVIDSARLTLMSRARAITSTLGLVIRTQRRGGGIISQQRLESALADLIRPGEVESIALLNAENEVLVSAGTPLTETHMSAGVTWTANRMLLANLVDLGTNVFPEPDGERRAIVVNLPPPPTNRPAFTPRRDNDDGDGESRRRGWRGRFSFGRPPWMSEEEYQQLSQQKGVHSFVIALSTGSIQQAARQDIWMRFIICALAVAAASGGAFAWRSFQKSTDLELRLVKASEMNSHLKELNLAAAGLAHETRNPLNIIRGLAQVISKTGEASSDVRQNSMAIVEESDRLTAQLNEFINYSRPREVRKTAVDLARVASEVTRALSYDAEEKQVQVEVKAGPEWVEADEQLLRQTIFNLLLNAIQAAGTGDKVAIGTQRIDGELVLEIADTGPGVPPERRAEIFKPYFTTHEHGSGLGLAIVRQIVFAHGWSIECLENQPRGAIFRISRIRVKT